MWELSNPNRSDENKESDNRGSLFTKRRTTINTQKQFLKNMSSYSYQKETQIFNFKRRDNSIVK